MNNLEKSIVEQLVRLIAFKNENEAELKQIPLLWLMLEEAVAYYTRLLALIKEEEKTGKVLTQQKENIFTDLFNETVIVGGMLSSYGNFKEFIPFQKIEGIKKSELKRARDEDAITMVQNMVTVINEAPAQRVEAGITDELLNAIEEKIEAAEAILYEPKEFRLKQHRLNLSIDAELSGFKALLNDSIKPSMFSQYAESNPGLYGAFLNAIHIDALPRKKKVLTGSFKNEEGEPVSRVWVQLDGAKPVRKGGEKGQFHFYNVQPGQHSLVFRKKSYRDEKRVFMLEADHSKHFNIVLHLEDVVEESVSET